MIFTVSSLAATLVRLLCNFFLALNAVRKLFLYHLLVCIENAKKLTTLLMRGTKTWIVMLSRLILFTIILTPGWIGLLKYWFFDSFILRNVEFGLGAKYRNLMDVYLPLGNRYEGGAPVVVFVSGGAWIIGYKLWSCLVAKGLASLGMLVIVPDYRNFPQGDLPDMIEDVRSAVLWASKNADRFGGDHNKLVLAGQSAGAHICLCLVVEDLARRLALLGAAPNTTPVTQATVNKSNGPAAIIAANRQADADSHSSSSSSSCSDHTTTTLTPTSPTQEAGEDEEEEEDDDDEAFSSPAATTANIKLTELGRQHDHDHSHSRRTRTAAAAAAATNAASVSFLGQKGSSSSSERGVSRSFDSYDEDNDNDNNNDINENRNKTPPAALINSANANNEDDGKDNDVDDCNESYVFREVMSPVFPSHSPSPSPSATTSTSQHSHGDEEKQHHACCKQGEDILGLVKLFVGISGPYDLLTLADHLHDRGLDSSILSWICRGDMARFSPATRLKQMLLLIDEEGQDNNSQRQRQRQRERASWVKKQLPPLALFHGGRDTTIPCHLSRSLHSMLSCDQARLKASYREYCDWSHTDAILEGPLLGTGRLFYDMSAAIEQAVLRDSKARRVTIGGGYSGMGGEYDIVGSNNSNNSGINRPMAPWFAVALARWINPF